METFSNVILLVACLALVITLYRTIFSNKAKRDLKMKLTGGRTSFTPSRKLVTLETSVVGMYYRGIDFPFECDAYLKLDLHNKYDPDAVAVYSDTEVHIGYLPKGDSIFHKLLSYGVEVKGYVDAWEPADTYKKRLFAKFYAQVDKEIVETMQKTV